MENDAAVSFGLGDFSACSDLVIGKEHLFFGLRNESFPVRYQFPFTFTHVVQHHVRICGFPTTLSKFSEVLRISFFFCQAVAFTPLFFQRKSKFSKSCVMMSAQN